MLFGKGFMMNFRLPGGGTLFELITRFFQFFPNLFVFFLIIFLSFQNILEEYHNKK